MAGSVSLSASAWKEMFYLLPILLREYIVGGGDYVDSRWFTAMPFHVHCKTMDFSF